MGERLAGPRRRVARPRCEALESRALLSLAAAAVQHVPKPIPLVSTLPTSTSTSSSSSGTTTSSSGATASAPLAAGVPRISYLSLIPDAPTLSPSTVPSNGDTYPHGVAVIPRGYLVSNYGDSNAGLGLGTTIVKIARDGTQSTFYQAPQGFGLSGALGVLKKGYVIVGNVPTTDGTSDTVGQGSLIFLNRFGKVVGQVSNAQLLDGPWGLAVVDNGDTATVFVSNVLSGTVTRLNLRIRDGHIQVTGARQIASGYGSQPDPDALELGPSGLAYNAATGVLYVASTADNAIYAIPNAASRTTDAGTGISIFSDPTYLRGPVGLAIAPNGDLLTTNGDAVNTDFTQTSEVVEFTPRGQFVDEFSLTDAPGANAGMAVVNTTEGTILATANDFNATLDIRRFVKGSGVLLSSLSDSTSSTLTSSSSGTTA